MAIRASMTPRGAITLLVAALVFLFSFLFRFNDPGGSFAGLTDDHFFYLIRGWQILFGDLPVREFVDHGAPLYYYVGAAVQTLFGRGTLSELVFSVVAISLGAAMTFWLAARASGSILLGLIGAAFQILLEPRFYNYPKILAYTAAIPALWWFADRPSGLACFVIALITVIAFLFRHDHGAFIAMAMAALLLLLGHLSLRDRLRYAVLYGLLVVALVAPYLIFIDVNGGIVSYFRQASAWAEKDRARAPVVWPGLFENPDGVSEAAAQGSGVTRAVAVTRDNIVAWMFYSELLLPFLALFVLAASHDGFRPGWPHARAKLAMVAVLAIALDVGFLRSPLAARLADPSVPLAILVAWLARALPYLAIGRASLRPGIQRWRWAVRGLALTVGAAVAFVLAAGMTRDLYRRLDRSALLDRTEKIVERIGNISTQLRLDWDLATWTTRENVPDLINLALYVNACTAPTDRVLVEAYMPQVLALAKRAFAGGHADLRPGFFRTEEAQELTLSRLKSQSVPVILLDTDRSYENFRKSFPLVIDYIDREYRLAGTHTFDGRFGISLFVRRDLEPRGTWAPLGWPCYASGLVGS